MEIAIRLDIKTLVIGSISKVTQQTCDQNNAVTSTVGSAIATAESSTKTIQLVTFLPKKDLVNLMTDSFDFRSREMWTTLRMLNLFSEAMFSFMPFQTSSEESESVNYVQT